MITQADQRRLGIGEGEAIAGPVRGLGGWPRGSVAPAVIGAAIGPWRKPGLTAQRRQNQSRRTHQPQKVHSGDHEHQLEVA